LSTKQHSNPTNMEVEICVTKTNCDQLGHITMR